MREKMSDFLNKHNGLGFTVLETKDSKVDHKEVDLRMDHITKKNYYAPHKRLTFVSFEWSNYLPPSTEEWRNAEDCKRPWTRKEDKCHQCPHVEACCAANAAKGRSLIQDSMAQIVEFKKTKKKMDKLSPLARDILEAWEESLQKPKKHKPGLARKIINFIAK